MTANAHKINQDDILVSSTPVNPFHRTLKAHGLHLDTGEIIALQVNVGLKCDRECTHCHLDAGPMRKEMMPRDTMDSIIHFTHTNDIKVIDITGGAPELHEDIEYFIKKLSLSGSSLILRSNLSAIYSKNDPFFELLTSHKVKITASFPSLNEVLAEAVRGKGAFTKSIKALQKLNTYGYGAPSSELALNLVVNPSGAFLSPSQDSLEKEFRKVLKEKWDIDFNSLFSFANVPLGRFKIWLIDSGRYEKYMRDLETSFNPQAVSGLMCRIVLSVSWDGYLYDCDFNQAADLYMKSRKTHISEITSLPKPGQPIQTGDHCYACAAGAGFT